jgi:hypothetical protein
LVERVLAKHKVVGSKPITRSIKSVKCLGFLSAFLGGALRRQKM